MCVAQNGFSLFVNKISRKWLKVALGNVEKMRQCADADAATLSHMRIMIKILLS